MKYIVYQTTSKINNKIYIGVHKTENPDVFDGFDTDENLLEVFETMTDCVKAGYKNAKLVALSKRNFCKGFVFKYLD